MRLLILTLAFAGLAACASGTSPSSPDGASADAADGQQLKRVCRREKTTGSRTKGARICKDVPID